MSRLTTSEARKKDTREKIALGGLVLKAGLQAEQQELLLGLFMATVHYWDTDIR